MKLTGGGSSRRVVQLSEGVPLLMINVQDQLVPLQPLHLLRMQEASLPEYQCSRRSASHYVAFFYWCKLFY